MVEVRGCGVDAEPSQGTHLFQNITSLQIPYLVIEDENCEEAYAGKDAGAINWKWLRKQNGVQDMKYVRHIRLDRPFILKVNGQNAESVGFHKIKK